MEKNFAFSAGAKSSPQSSGGDSPHPEQLPGKPESLSLLFAIIGIALLTFGREAFRYPTTLQNEGISFAAQSPLSTSWIGPTVIIAGLFLTAAFLSSEKKTDRLFSHIPFGISICLMILAGLSKFLDFRYGFATDLLDGLGYYCGYYVFGIWAYRLYSLQGRASLVVLASSFLISGFLQILAVLLRPEVAQLAALFTPAASALAYYLFLKNVARNEECSDALANDPSGLNESPQNWDLPRWFIWTLAFSFVCYGLLSFDLHSYWNNLFAENKATSECQIVGGLGVVGLSLLILGFSNLRTPLSSNLFFSLVKTMLFCAFSLGICNALFQHDRIFVSLNFLLLDSAHKLVLIAIWSVPLYLKTKGQPLRLLFFFLGTYQAGASLSNLLCITISSDFLLIFGCLAFIALDLCLELGLLFRPKVSPGHEPSAMGVSDFGYQTKPDGTDHILFRACLEDNFGLTKREVEVVEAIIGDMSLKEISSALFISPETAKAHRRNALKKLDVSSNQELKERLEEIRENEFRQYLNQEISA